MAAGRPLSSVRSLQRRGAWASSKLTILFMNRRPDPRGDFPPAPPWRRCAKFTPNWPHTRWSVGCVLRRKECCQFELTGLTPYLTRAKCRGRTRAARSGRRQLPAAVNGACPMLEAQPGRCLIYADRPFACRTHFCAPAGGPLARGEVLDLIRRLETIDAQLGGDGPESCLRRRRRTGGNRLTIRQSRERRRQPFLRLNSFP